MVSTRRSSGLVEDANALTLRSRTIDVESRHLNNSQELPGHETPRKRRKIGASSIDDASVEINGNPPKNEGCLSVSRPNHSGGEESQSSPIVALSTSTPSPEEYTIEACTAPSYPRPPESSKGGQNVHKRFESEEHGAIAGKDANVITSVTQNDLEITQARAHSVPKDASDDDSAPETFDVNLRQRLPFTAAPKEPRSGGVKPGNSAPFKLGRKESAPMLAAQPGSKGRAHDGELPSLPEKNLATSERPANTNPLGSKKVKDVTKDGVTYRTISPNGLRGQTSSWLPAKAIPASRELKERLLVRKRVQNVSNGRRSKFVTSR